MVFDAISNINQYVKLHPLFPQTFEYIKNTDLTALKPGRHVILEHALFVIIQHGSGQSRAESKLECHRKFIDIQLVLDGTDEMGWRPLADCHEVLEEYNLLRDVQFFKDLPINWLITPANKFCIFFPEDAHSGMVSGHAIHKAVFKIAVNPAT